MTHGADWDDEYESGCGHVCNCCAQRRKESEDELKKVREITESLVKEFPEFKWTSYSTESTYDYKGRIELKRVNYKVVPTNVPPDFYQGAKVVIQERMYIGGYGDTLYHKPSVWIERLLKKSNSK